jgi:hypothetical protein
MHYSATQELDEPQAVRIIGSIFRARRDLVGMIKKRVLPKVGLTLERADLLLDIWGATKAGWADPRCIQGTEWVTFAALRDSLVHAPELLTRRIADLEKLRYLKSARLTRPEALSLGVHGRSKKVRLEKIGEEKAKELYETYGTECLRLLSELRSDAQEHARDVLNFNNALMERLRWRI